MRGQTRLLLPVALAVIGCAPDGTALVPSARLLAWDGQTAPEGSLRVEGAISYTPIVKNLLPQKGDSALHIPAVSADGAVAVALARGFEMGARYSYAAYAWSDPSAVGTPPIPSHPSVTGFGPEFRGTLRFGDAEEYFVGIAGNAMFYDVPTADWTPDATCGAPSDCYDSPALSSAGLAPIRYRLANEDRLNHLVWNLGVYPGLELGGGTYGHVFFAWGVHSAFENQGFTNEGSPSSLDGAGFVALAGAGYGIKVNFFHASVTASHAFTTRPEHLGTSTYGSPVNYDFITIGATVGVDIPLWEAKAASPAR